EPRIIKFSPPSDRGAWEQTANGLRRDLLDKLIFRGAAAPWREAQCAVVWLDTIPGGPGYRIRKFRYEALPGMWIPGLLYLPEKLAGQVPVAIHVNGHAPEGKAVAYKQLRSINLVKRGMLVLNVEWFGMGQLRTSGFAHGRMNQLELCGAGGLAPFYLALQRAVDIAVKLEHADPKRIAVSGLSGGGWQTILIGALDERVALANPVAGYGSFRTNILCDDMGDSEQSPSDMATIADYSHLTAMRAPRPTLLTYNASDDCCFKAGHALPPLTDAAVPVFALLKAAVNLRTHINHVPGTHNFEQDNREQLYGMLGDVFYPGDEDFACAEIPSEAELKTADELQVPLPADNIDLHRLSERLLLAMPAKMPPPTEQPSAARWQEQSRDRLRSLLHMPTYTAISSDEKSRDAGKYQITHRILKIGSHWSVPSVDIRATSTMQAKSAIVIADAGRSAAGEAIALLVEQGWRAWAVDPLLYGESKIKAQDPEYTYPLFLAAVGERALGIQAAQLMAIARLVGDASGGQGVKIVAVGPRASMAALAAAATAPREIAEVELNDAHASLKELVERDIGVESEPELFAFGLLAEFDVHHLVAMAAPRPVVFRHASQHAKRDLAP
ncbi:MAG TPA: acetylxylan esterase, partial [Pirellulales bacterium]|nr:acetylxylan esterase [Pirellulales bacterium]